MLLHYFQDLFICLFCCQAHAKMFRGTPCNSPFEQFKDGITNGAKWYSVSGGMQDWMYINTSELLFLLLLFFLLLLLFIFLIFFRDFIFKNTLFESE